MSDLNFGNGSWEAAGGVIMNALNELHGIIKGNGKDGMQVTLSNLVTTIETTEENRQEFQAKRDQEIKDALETHNTSMTQRTNRQTLIISVVGLILAAVQLFHR